MIKAPPKYFRVVAPSIVLLSLCATQAKADNTAAPGLPTYTNSFAPLFPKFTLQGGLGDNNYGYGDALVPLYGNPNGIFYTDINGQDGSDGSFYGGLGFGARFVHDNHAIYGLYAFVDRSQTFSTMTSNSGNNFNSDSSFSKWASGDTSFSSNSKSSNNYASPFAVGPTFNKWTVFNPGIEAMNNQWDGRINGYIPIGPDKANNGFFPGDLNNGRVPNSVFFIDHTEFMSGFNNETVLGNGADGDIGYTLSHFDHLRFHAGSYYFDMTGMPTNHVYGGEAGVDVPVNKYATILLNDSFDNLQHNNAVISLRVTFGGITQPTTPVIQDRMLDPIYRHLGTIYTNSGIPSESAVLNNGRVTVANNNIWFFSPYGYNGFNPVTGVGNCTFEHPCNSSVFNQTNINTINGISPLTNFYFAPGIYPLGNYINLNSGQSMYGRSDNFTRSASFNGGFPTFIGGIMPLGDNHLESFSLLNNNGNLNSGINIQNANNIWLKNVQLGALNNQYGYDSPLLINNGSDISVKDSNIFSLQYGINVNNSSLLLEKSNITVSNPTGVTVGIYDQNSSINATSDTFNVNGISPTGVEILSGVPAIVNLSNNTFNISDSNVTANSVGGAAVGISVFANSNTVIMANNNTFNVNAVNKIGEDAYGIFDLVGNITANNNLFNVTASGPIVFTPNAYGIKAVSGNVNATGNHFVISASYKATGVASEGGSVVTITNNVFDITSLNNNDITGGGTVINNNNIFNFHTPELDWGNNYVNSGDNYSDDYGIG